MANNWRAKITDYCACCHKRKAVKPCVYDDSYEDYFCASCRKDLGGMIQVLRIDYSDL